MPTGITVSRHGRILVNLAHWDDDVPFAVAELRQEPVVVLRQVPGVGVGVYCAGVRMDAGTRVGCGSLQSSGG